MFGYIYRRLYEWIHRFVRVHLLIPETRGQRFYKKKTKSSHETEKGYRDGEHLFVLFLQKSFKWKIWKFANYIDMDWNGLLCASYSSSNTYFKPDIYTQNKIITQDWLFEHILYIHLQYLIVIVFLYLLHNKNNKNKTQTVLFLLFIDEELILSSTYGSKCRFSSNRLFVVLCEMWCRVHLWRLGYLYSWWNCLAPKLYRNFISTTSTNHMVQSCHQADDKIADWRTCAYVGRKYARKKIWIWIYLHVYNHILIL